MGFLIDGKECDLEVGPLIKAHFLVLKLCIRQTCLS